MRLLVSLKLGVQSNWATVACGGIIEIVVKGGEVDFLFYSILVGHAQKVLGVHSEKQINGSLRELFVVE